MRKAAAGVLLAVCFFGVAKAQNAVQEVVKLMEKLEKRISKESETEAAAYDKFACFCKEQADEKLYAIETKTARIDELTAAIKKAEAHIAELTAQMEQATTNKDHLEGEWKAADEKDRKERAEYQKMHDDIRAALDQLDKAVEAIKASADQTDDDLLLQVGTKVRKLIETEERNDPHAYENKGGKTLEILNKIKIKFEKRLLMLEDWETDREHAVKMEQQARKFEIDSETKIIVKCQSSIGETSEQKSKDEGEKSQLEADRGDDKDFLDKVTEDCENKAKSWDARSQRRVGELQAMSTAIEILKGDASSKYGSAKLALRQSKKAVSFLQVGSVAVSRADAERAATAAVLRTLEKRATALKSSLLFALALEVKDGPFDSVKKMIEELIDKIDAEQTAEEEEIAECKKDLEEAQRKKAKSQSRIEKEEANIIKLGSQMETDADEAKELGNEVSELYKALKEATTLRNGEAADNKATLDDAKAGKASIDKAIDVLKNFYDAGFEGALLQQRHRSKQDPEAPDAAGFLGDDAAADPAATEESKGIFGLLQTIQGDYESTIESVSTEEGEAKDEYDAFKTSSEEEIAEKNGVKKAKEDAIKQAVDDTEQAKMDLAQFTALRAEAEHELSILMPRCLALGASAQMRKERREEEKSALKDAIKILEQMMPAEPTKPEFLQRRA